MLLGQDWDALIVDAHDAELTRTLVLGPDGPDLHPRVARRSHNPLLVAGFHEVRVEFRTGVFADGTALRILTPPRPTPGPAPTSDAGRPSSAAAGQGSGAAQASE
ncbi:hypothetical protein ACFVUN_13585 [Kitasatospora griseola]|uniref:hypothetical protein n=1 Tax=Kitasatospora griseola TaxID=2064 RepID=UPI0036D79DF3